MACSCVCHRPGDELCLECCDGGPMRAAFLAEIERLTGSSVAEMRAVLKRTYDVHPVDGAVLLSLWIWLGAILDERPVGKDADS